MFTKANPPRITDKEPQKVSFETDGNGRIALVFEEVPDLLFISSNGVGTFDQLFINGQEITEHYGVTIHSKVGELTKYDLKRYACVVEGE